MWVTQPYFWEDTHKIGFTPSRTSNLAFDTDSEPHGPLQLRYDALAKTQGAQLPCLSPFPPRTQRSECGGLSSGDGTKEGDWFCEGICPWGCDGFQGGISKY